MIDRLSHTIGLFLLHSGLILNHVSEMKVFHLSLKSSFMLFLILNLIFKILNLLLETISFSFSHSCCNRSFSFSLIQSIIEVLYLGFEVSNLSFVVLSLTDQYFDSASHVVSYRPG